MTVGTITDDKRLFEVPKVRVAALKVTDAARARILKVRRQRQRCHAWRPLAALGRQLVQCLQRIVEVFGDDAAQRQSQHAVRQ